MDIDVCINVPFDVITWTVGVSYSGRTWRGF